MDELFPDTRNWTDEQKIAYMDKHMPLIMSMVNQYGNSSDPAVSRDDMAQEAKIAFLASLDTYDNTRGVRFSTFCYKNMKNAINMVHRLTNAAKRKPIKPPIPFDAILDADGNSQNSGENSLVAEESQPAYYKDSVEERCAKREIVDTIYRMLNTIFTPTEKEIFLSLSLKQKTQAELAAQLDCSQAKVSTAYKNIRISLQYELKSLGYDESELI